MNRHKKLKRQNEELKKVIVAHRVISIIGLLFWLILLYCVAESRGACLVLGLGGIE